MVVTNTVQQDRLRELHTELARAGPRLADMNKAVAASVRLGRLASSLLLDPSLEQLGNYVFYRLADMAAAAPFPMLLASATPLCERLCSRFPPRQGELLTRMLERPDRVRLLLPFFAPHREPSSFVSLYAEVCQQGQQQVLLSNFDVSDWLSRGTPELEEAAGLARLAVRAATQGGSGQALHEQTAALVARYRFPLLIEAVLGSMLAHEPQLRLEAWRRVLLDGELLAELRDPVLAARLSLQLKDFLWQKRSLANPPRGSGLPDACPGSWRALAELSATIARARCFARSADSSGPYALLQRPPDPAGGWRVFAQLLLPFVQTLGVRPEQRPSPAALSFPPWLPSASASVAEVLRTVWGPALAQIVKDWPETTLKLLLE